MTSLKQQEGTKRRPAEAKKPMRDDKEQSRLFIKTAREIGADEEKSAAGELLGRLAKMPPQPHTPSKTKRRT
jgi:hypothetical protein